eukprot:13717491-Alexandrium_andersonii.AAC.1
MLLQQCGYEPKLLQTPLRLPRTVRTCPRSLSEPPGSARDATRKRGRGRRSNGSHADADAYAYASC